ncbi:hypothetical protein A5755_00290 [Mycolicibacterium fortuitum]|nr:hypothetical protein A5754_31710 [Mycolicibacterium fortuitum]OBB81078.1 hypothetical protein A5755_00290 [Mycolicibacterium fortuitum]OBF69697.1 hypothetical protein A5751_32335 [Mycolicibacterium fortuitum]
MDISDSLLGFVERTAGMGKAGRDDCLQCQQVMVEFFERALGCGIVIRVAQQTVHCGGGHRYHRTCDGERVTVGACTDPQYARRNGKRGCGLRLGAVLLILLVQKRFECPRGPLERELNFAGVGLPGEGSAALQKCSGVQGHTGFDGEVLLGLNALF